MQKNFEICAHCEQRLDRLSEKTPLINRTDGKTFHLTLFSGPYRRGIRVGKFSDEILICTFAYVHAQTGPRNKHVAVTIARADPTEAGAIIQVNALADNLVDLIAVNIKLDPEYRFDKGQLEPGLK